jgi:hypothetical protein
MKIELEELTAVRNGMRYELHDEPPASGTWWAVRSVPVEFPGNDFFRTTCRGEQVEQACIVCCQRRHEDGLWQWCALTPAAKSVFGNLVFDYGKRNTWMYISESSAPVQDNTQSCINQAGEMDA